MRLSFVEKETTMTTDKNNSCHPGATAPGFKIAARFRGEKEEVVFTSCSGCFQNNLQASASRRALTGKAAILAAATPLRVTLPFGRGSRYLLKTAKLTSRDIGQMDACRRRGARRPGLGTRGSEPHSRRSALPRRANCDILFASCRKVAGWPADGGATERNKKK